MDALSATTNRHNKRATSFQSSRPLTLSKRFVSLFLLRETRSLDLLRTAPSDERFATVVEQLRISQGHLPALGYFENRTGSARSSHVADQHLGSLRALLQPRNNRASI